LNDAPIITEEDGDFNVLCLMDAGSCYILGNDFVPILSGNDPAQVAGCLVAAAQERTGCLPGKFFASDEFKSDQFAALAKRIDVELTFCDEDGLAPFVAEAKEGFLAHVGGGRRQ
jgi:hypothetical protein